ncbi:hypothetical protein NFI96_009236 [Prochilodus magdalenae]|nr:hypothetical protein NFI96_009236 [Prochilodus magdalenae]
MSKQSVFKSGSDIAELRRREEQAIPPSAGYEGKLSDLKRSLQYSLDLEADPPAVPRTGPNGPSFQPPEGVELASSPVFGGGDHPWNTTPGTTAPQSSCAHWNRFTAQDPSDRDLDKIACNIARFKPKPDGSNDVHIYLKDIDYLRNFPTATAENKTYLIKVTSSREVSSFIERQPISVRLIIACCQALVEEFSNLDRLSSAPRNEPGMEEDLHFKSLFVQNLHPNTSHFLGVAACPRTLNSKQLHDLAIRGFAKYQQTTNKRVEAPSVLSVDTRPLTMELQGAPNPDPPGSLQNPRIQKRS